MIRAASLRLEFGCGGRAIFIPVAAGGRRSGGGCCVRLLRSPRQIEAVHLNLIAGDGFFIGLSPACSVCIGVQNPNGSGGVFYLNSVHVFYNKYLEI